MKGVLGFIVGLFAGLTVAGCLGGILGYSFVKYAEASSRKGWMVVPVVVYAKDVAAGELITLDALSQRQVPEQFVTSSVVKPDSTSYLINQRVLIPAAAGDPARWTHFVTTNPKLSREAGAACAAKFPPALPFKTVAELKHSVEAQ